MNTVNICNKCPTGCDSLTNNKTIELTCGHVFGKSCLLNWVESSNQENCFLCNNPLTDNEISEIKPVPLQERTCSAPEQATKLFCRTISKLAPSFALSLAVGAPVGAAGAVLSNVANLLFAGEAPHGVVNGAVAGAAGAFVGCATIAVGAAVGSIGAATGAGRPASKTAAKVAAGAFGALGVALASRTISTAGGVAGFIGDTAWLGVNSANTITGAVVGAVAGAYGGTHVADYVYHEQEKMNSEKKSL